MFRRVLGSNFASESLVRWMYNPSEKQYIYIYIYIFWISFCMFSAKISSAHSQLRDYNYNHEWSNWFDWGWRCLEDNNTAGKTWCNCSIRESSACWWYAQIGSHSLSLSLFLWFWMKIYTLQQLWAVAESGSIWVINYNRITRVFKAMGIKTAG